MVPLDKAKKKIQPWKKAIFHLSVCFILGFFMGFAPSSSGTPPASPVDWKPSSQVSPPSAAAGRDQEPELPPRKLLIAVTTMGKKDKHKIALLRRLADALALVPPPLLWLVVEAESEVQVTAELLRKTTVMYRHLPSDGNFAIRDREAEERRQRNIALAHIEKHRLDGIVHFAPISTVYDLRLFDDIRKTEAMIGAWPTASVAANGKTVVVEGPVCRSSRVIGWRSRHGSGSRSFSSVIDLSSLAFNSSLLWRRNSSLSDISQDSISVVQQVVLQERNELEAIPSPDCSRIMTWRLPLPKRDAAPRPQA